MSAAAIKQQEQPSRVARELWHCAGIGDLDRLNQLLDQGVDVNVGDRTGVTALMRAAYHGQEPIVRALIEHGADLDARDNGGLTAMTMARHAGHHGTVDLLLSAGAQGRPEAAARRRHMGSISEEAVRVATDNKPRKKSTEVRTLHDPPEIWDLVRTGDAVVEHPSEPRPFNNAASRILDVQETVHLTQPRDDVEAAIPFQRSGFPRAVVFGIIALLVCAGAVFGVLSLRSSSASATKRNEEPATDSAATNPIAPSTQSSTTEKAGPAEPNPIAPVREASKAISPPTSTARNATASSALTTAKKPVVKQKANTTKGNESFFVESKEDVRRTNDDRLKPVPARKEPSKPQPSQPIDPPKSAAPKPKVIQWP